MVAVAALLLIALAPVCLVGVCGANSVTVGDMTEVAITTPDLFFGDGFARGARFRVNGYTRFDTASLRPLVLYQQIPGGANQVYFYRLKVQKSSLRMTDARGVVHARA